MVTAYAQKEFATTVLNVQTSNGLPLEFNYTVRTPGIKKEKNENGEEIEKQVIFESRAKRTLIDGGYQTRIMVGQGGVGLSVDVPVMTKNGRRFTVYSILIANIDIEAVFKTKDKQYAFALAKDPKQQNLPTTGQPFDASVEVQSNGKVEIKLIDPATGKDLASLKLEEVKGYSTYLQWLALIIIGIAIFLISAMIFIDQGQSQAGEKLDEADAGPRAKSGFILKYSRPFFRHYITPVVQGMKYRSKIKATYKRRLAIGGLTKELSPEDFYSFKLFLVITFPIIFLAIRAYLGEKWPLGYSGIAALIGYFYPNIWLMQKRQVRQAEIISVMPFYVDMLALSVEAGLDFAAAMQKVVERAQPSAMRDEFEIFLKETKIGASRAEGLRNLSWRVDLVQVSSFCASLIAADSIGASLGPILKGLSNEMRQRRSAEVEKKGATAATKMLLPMILFIVPAVFLTIAAPLVVEFMGSK
jgi:tight adherence protein C